MSTIPLPPVPTTVYAPGVQVKSADLNDYQTFMAAVRAELDSTEVVSMLYTWTVFSLAASQSFQLVTQDLYASTDADCVVDHIKASLIPDRRNTNGLELTVQNAAVNAAVRLNRSGPAEEGTFSFIDDLDMAIEVQMLMTSIGASGVDIHMGFHQNPDLNTLAFADGTAEGFVMFEKLSSDTNWFATLGNSGTDTRVDTGTPPIANEFQTLRVEYHGLLTPIGIAAGNVAVVRFYIDGVLEHEETGATVPDGATPLDLVIRARANGTGPAGDFKLTMGPVRLLYTTHLAP